MIKYYFISFGVLLVWEAGSCMGESVNRSIKSDLSTAYRFPNNRGQNKPVTFLTRKLLIANILEAGTTG